MSSEGEVHTEPVQAPVEEPVEAVVTVESAVCKILKDARVVDGVVCGLRQVVKHLERKDCHICVLATDCDHDKYKALVRALCKTKDIPCIEAVSGVEIGEFAGIFGRKADGSVNTSKHCSSAVVTKFGVASKELAWFMENVMKTGDIDVE